MKEALESGIQHTEREGVLKLIRVEREALMLTTYMSKSRLSLPTSKPEGLLHEATSMVSWGQMQQHALCTSMEAPPQPKGRSTCLTFSFYLFSPSGLAEAHDLHVQEQAFSTHLQTREAAP